MTMSGKPTATRGTTTSAHVPWGILIAATLLTAATIAIIWLAAVPWGPLVCPAIYPAPKYCIPEYRTGVATIATIGVAVIYLATVLAAFAGGRWLRAAKIGTGVLVAAPIVTYLCVAFIPGFAVTTSQPTIPAPITEASESRAYADIPEFAEPQTEEDLLPGGMRSSTQPIEPSTIRNVGTIDGYTIFIAQSVDFENVCFVAVLTAANLEVSSGCASWTGATDSPVAAMWGVDENLQVQLGDPALVDATGEAVPLSESVTAYRTR